MVQAESFNIDLCSNNIVVTTIASLQVHVSKSMDVCADRIEITGHFDDSVQAQFTSKEIELTITNPFSGTMRLDGDDTPNLFGIVSIYKSIYIFFNLIFFVDQPM